MKTVRITVTNEVLVNDIYPSYNVDGGDYHLFPTPNRYSVVTSLSIIMDDVRILRGEVEVVDNRISYTHEKMINVYRGGNNTYDNFMVAKATLSYILSHIEGDGKVPFKLKYSIPNIGTVIYELEYGYQEDRE